MYSVIVHLSLQPMSSIGCIYTMLKELVATQLGISFALKYIIITYISLIYHLYIDKV